MNTHAPIKYIGIIIAGISSLLTACSTSTHRTYAGWSSINPGMTLESFREMFESKPGRIGEHPVATNTVESEEGPITVYIYEVYDSSSVRSGAPFVDHHVYVGFRDGKLLEYGLGDQWRAWSTNYDWLTLSLTPQESFWEKGERPCDVDWECTVYKVAEAGNQEGTSKIKLLLDTPYVEEQTLNGLWPNPVSVVIAQDSELAKEYGGKFNAGDRIRVQGAFSGFRKLNLRQGRDGTLTASGKSSDMAGALAMLFGSEDATSEAKSYATNQRLKIGTRWDGSMVLPNLEVTASHIEIISQ